MQFKQARLILATSLVALAAAAPLAHAADNVAVVNGKAIPASRVDALVRELSKQGQTDSPQLRAAIKDKLIGSELLAQEAERRNLTKTEEVQLALQSARDQIMALALMQDLSKKSPIKDDEVKAEFEKMKVAMGNKEYHARHILVETEDQAKSLIDQLKKGAKFEDLAKQSKDAGSAANGGDLGWTVPGRFVKEFGEALTKLEKGKFSDTPVKTQFGYHVIKVEDSRPVKLPTFEEAKPRIIQVLQGKRLEQLQGELRAKATIK